MRILVADDDPILLKTLGTILRRWGHDVVSASSGSEALEALLAADAPRVAVLDWLMPGMNGLDVCRALRQDASRPYTYVILLSGRSERTDRIEGLDAGADEYLVKPFDTRELEARLRTGERVLALDQGSQIRLRAAETVPLQAMLLDRVEVSGIIEAALGGRITMLPLDRELPDEGLVIVELRAPDLLHPVRLLAETAGPGSNGFQPALLRPTDDVSAAQLRAFLDGEALRRRGSIAPGNSVAGPQDTQELTEDDRISATPQLGDLSPKRNERDSAAPDPRIGRVLGNGRYLLTAVVGSGSSGVVYRARHTALDRDVAIKVLHPLYQVHRSFVGRFEREARAMSKLDHESITRVIDFGREPDGTLYLVMELLEGETLDRLLEREGTLPSARALDIMAQVLGALAVAHEQGVVHRDVKPENVMILHERDERGGRRDRVKVCDFGIAKLTGGLDESGPHEAKLTQAGMLCGTPQYMAPEQASGADVDARADLYACGIILYELVTGEVPFQAETPLGLLSKHVFQDPVPPSRLNRELSPHVETVILRALAKDREHRQPSARAFREQLKALAGIGKPFAYAPDSKPGRAVRKVG